MAKILTVHGTFATGPTEGDAWWQRGGACARDLQSLVESEDGSLDLEPFIWDGLNSERSRQLAAERLQQRMAELETAGERYVVIGHSHGGSVAAAALVRAADKGQTLGRLSRWVSVGTPFIQSKRSFLLFSRLGRGGKTAFLTAFALLTSTLVFIAAGTFKTGQPGEWKILAHTATHILVLSGLIAYLILWLTARNRLPWHKPATIEAARRSFAARWLALRHEDDEAVQGLGAFEKARRPIFPRDFAVQGLSRTAILIAPAALYIAMAAVFAYTEKRAAIEAKPPAQTATKPGPAVPGPAASAPVEAKPATVSDGADGVAWWMPVLAIGISTVVFAGLPSLVYFTVLGAARPTSALLSIGLNHMAWKQLQRSSLGGDIDGESVRHAAHHPPWLKVAVPTLPKELGGEISKVSDEAAARAISGFRSALSDLEFYDLDRDGKDALNAFLCGNELIHTTYFRVPRFRKLLAFAIARSPGFRPSRAFLDDPEFALIEGWYEELNAASSAAAMA